MPDKSRDNVVVRLKEAALECCHHGEETMVVSVEDVLRVCGIMPPTG